MTVKLNAVEARVLGCLIEKDLTTPDYYPLSLHALTTACNQKSNREPIMNLGESEVQEALDSLTKQGLTAQRPDFSARVPKYAHKLRGTVSKTFDFDRAELAMLAELLLRGPQTPGELRARASRMNPFADLAAVEATLRKLAQRSDGPFVVELARQPGRREARYACLLTDVPAEPSSPAAIEPVPGGLDQRVQVLEETVAILRAELDDLRARLGG